MSMYADDIAVWSQHKDKLRAQAMVQEAVEAFRNWSSEHRLSLNPSKCEVSFFSTDPAEAKWCPVISLNGQQFAVNKTPTFLGVKYDRTLTFRPQADAVKVRVLGRIRILASLASKDWGWSRNSPEKNIYGNHTQRPPLLWVSLAAMACKIQPHDPGASQKPCSTMLDGPTGRYPVGNA